MKKFMKGCAITALILVTAGLVLGIVGSTAKGGEAISRVVETVTGGRVKVNIGDWANWGITVGDQFFDSLEEVDYDIKDSISFNSHYDIQKGDVEKFRLEGAVTNLEIEAGGCFFRVENSGDDSFYMVAESAGKFQAYVESGTLHINTTTSVRTWNEINGSKIILYVPENYSYGEVEIDLGAGSLDFPGLKAEKVSLDVGAGRIIANGMEAGKLEADVGMGQIELTDMVVTDFEAEVGMGELIANGAVTGDIDAECSMGNLELLLEGVQEDFNYELSGAMGSLTLGGESYSGMANEKKIDNGAEKKMEIECSMGNVTIGFTN